MIKITTQELIEAKRRLQGMNGGLPTSKSELGKLINEIAAFPNLQATTAFAVISEVAGGVEDAVAKATGLYVATALQAGRTQIAKELIPQFLKAVKALNELEIKLDLPTTTFHIPTSDFEAPPSEEESDKQTAEQMVDILSSKVGA